jgi:ATP-binding cassette subfamily B protein
LNVLTKIKQRDISDCGAACLASICAYYNLQTSVASLRILSNTDHRGTTILGLVEAATKLGLIANGVRGTVESLSQIPTPAIAHLKRPNHSLHFVVLYKVKSHSVQIMDPADGEMHQIPLFEFLNLWTNVLVLIHPSNQFTEGNNTQSFFSRIVTIVKPIKNLILLALTGALLYTCLGLSVSLYLKIIIDRVIPSQNWLLLRNSTLGILTLLTMSLAIGSLKGLILIKITKHLDSEMILTYLKQIFKLPQSFFDRMRVGEILSRITEAVKIRTFITEVLTNFIITFIIIIISLILMFTYYWKLGLVMIFIIPVYAIIFSLMNKINKKTEHELIENSSALEALLIESMDKIYSIKTTNAQEFIANKIDDRFNLLSKTLTKSGQTQLASSISTEGAARYFTLLLLWFGTTLVIGGEITAGELLSFYAITGYFTGPASSLISINRSYQNAKIASDRLFEIVDLPTRTNDGTVAVRKSDFGDITLSNVAYRYGSRSSVFTSLNLILRKGLITAIAGPSGSGKSTLAAIITKIYPINNGQVIIGGLDINSLNQFDLREEITLIPQRPVLFSGTILENISMCNQPDLDRIHEVLNALDLNELIHALPEGYHTYLGENGVQLSGGQVQLIAIARALYKDPQIYIFDEVTASMDTWLEEKTLRLMTDLSKKGKTIILITHRPSTMSIADRIVLLQNGNVAEEGTFQELIDNKGKFYRMWEQLRVG